MPINDLPDGMSLPLDTVDNLSTLEEKLKDKKILKHMINYLGQIGGKNEGDSIRCILRTVFTNSLALKLNYAGRGQKIGIGKMLIRFVVIEAVKTNKCFSAKDSELEDLIKVWLRPACDRDGGRKADIRGHQRSISKHDLLTSCSANIETTP